MNIQEAIATAINSKRQTGVLRGGLYILSFLNPGFVELEQSLIPSCRIENHRLTAKRVTVVFLAASPKLLKLKVDGFSLGGTLCAV